MKIYVLETRSYNEINIVRIYSSHKSAIKDMDFIGEQEIKHVINDNDFRERWLKIEDQWYEQFQHKNEDDWPEWENPIEYNSGGIRIVEYDTDEMSFADQFEAIKQWQNTDRFHPLTCGNDSNHPNLEPYYDFCWPGVGIRCVQENCI